MTVVVVLLLLLLAVVLWFRVPRRRVVPTSTPPSRVELQSPRHHLVNELADAQHPSTVLVLSSPMPAW